ncbi:hypothetical protein [Fibrobacter sp. UWB3]|uniref:hypothetical protein n=1 Tax=Fibrobacter sp. UWB3 TaxID=1964357 RepID=UPI001130C449|nr:hypothetical protein [Fibrobacter sp. UWB3]
MNKIQYETTNTTISHIKEDKEASPSFYATFLLPFLMNNYTGTNGLLVFTISFIGLIALLAKTTLFYNNPILSILGYRIYNFKKDGSDFIGICSQKLEKKTLKINYNKVSNNVVFFEVIE